VQESDGGKEYAIAEVDSAKINIKLGIAEGGFSLSNAKILYINN
jgi:hypothetical protein